MLMQGPHDGSATDAVFCHVETGQAADIAAGSLCAWDITDNSAAAVGETRGYRVIVFPIAEADQAVSTPRMAGFAKTVITGNSSGSLSTTRMPPALIQVYGYMDGVLAHTPANAVDDNPIVAKGLICAGEITAGKVMGPDVAADTLADAIYACGWSYEAVADNTAASIKAFIRLM